MDGQVPRLGTASRRPLRVLRRRWRILRALLLLAIGAFGLGIMIRVLNPLPTLEGRSVSQALDPSADTPLRRAIAPVADANPGLAGIHPLLSGRDAFAARVHLARAATRTLDLQYYIWHADLSGTLLFDEVLGAAARGVRVRMLLDDNSTSGLDPAIAALDAHPNVEVRLFNPFVIRSPRLLGYLTDFRRLNRRMHNKAIIADNQAGVIGGRNVGDEYFHAGNDAAFVDLDLLAVGPVIADLSRSFDDYWASGSAHPAARILSEGVKPASIGKDAWAARKKPEGADYLRAIAGSNYVDLLSEGKLRFEWALASVVSDDPAKGLGRAPPQALLWNQLNEVLGRPQRHLDLVSGYFVPTRAGVDAFVRMARDGVKVRILTNAFEATDVPIVHAGYAKWRDELLREGIELHEMRGSQGEGVSRHVTAVGSTGSGASGAGSALHAKTFGVDGARMFVGSFNFDPRSRDLNTELGFIVESPELARRMEESLTAFLVAHAYQVELNGNGGLRWRERVGGREVVHATEPGTTWWKRAAVTILSYLPIDWLL